MTWLVDSQLRICLIVLLTSIAIFDVLWQRENTAMLTYASGQGQEAMSTAARLYEKQASVMDREFRESEVWTARHKLRWVYKHVETSFYNFVEKYASPKVVRYVSLLHYVVIFILTYLFCLMLLARLGNGINVLRTLVASFAFLGLVSSILHIGTWQEYYTPVEMLVVAAALYAGLRRNLTLFFVAVFVAVCNRESGIAVGLIYPILNPHQRWLWIAGPLSGASVLALFNLDLLAQPAFYDLNHFIVHPGVNDITILNFYEFGPSTWMPPLLHYLGFVTPVLFLAHRTFNDPIGRKLWIIFFMYFAILSIGSFLDNPYLFLIYIPIYFAIFGCALKSIVQEGSAMRLSEAS